MKTVTHLMFLRLVFQRFLLKLPMPKDGLMRNTGEIRRRIKILKRKVDHLLRLHPLAVNVVETLQMYNQYRRQPPNL